MPRPKGSKNKKTAATYTQEINFDEKIAAVEARINTLAEELKAQKAELKELVKAKEKQAAELAKQKAEEDKAKLLDAFKASGKTLEEALELLGK